MEEKSFATSISEGKWWAWLFYPLYLIYDVCLERLLAAGLEVPQ